MDQPTLGCKFPIVHTPDSNRSPRNPLPRTSQKSVTGVPPPLLRRVSHSDPHLEVPHFLSVQDRGFHGFHNILSGVFENSSLTVGRSDQMESIKSESDSLSALEPTSIDRNKSAVELCTSLNSEPSVSLRKVFSVASYSELHNGRNPSTNSVLSNAIGSYSTDITKSGLHNSTDDQGLTMNVRAGSAFSPSSLSTTTGAALTVPGHSDLASHPTHSALESSADSSTGTLNRVKSGMLGMFNRGFLAKPAMCNPEESYRYIMTLDR